MDTPNAIAKAFMELPKAEYVSLSYGTALQPRAMYQQRMNQWNVAKSHLQMLPATFRSGEGPLTPGERESLPSWYKHREDQSVESDLIKSAREEAKASGDYRQRGEFAESRGDKETAGLYEHIAEEEDAHYKEFTDHLKKVEKHEGQFMAAIDEQGREYEVMQMFCQRCGKEVFPRDFTIQNALRNFMITGLCQECQIKDESIRKVYKQPGGRLPPEVNKELKDLGFRTSTKLKYFPAVKHDPVKFAKSVLESNWFTEGEVPVYSGQAGLNPHGVPDSIWQAVLDQMGGEFYKVGDLYMLAGGEVDHDPTLAPATISYINISDPGGTELAAGSVISLESFEKANRRAEQMGVKPATGYPTPAGVVRPEHGGGQYRPGEGTPRFDRLEPATTMDDRFTIDCSFCGLLSSETRFNAALETAKRLSGKHNETGERISIFDRLAHKGACNLWDVNGKCLGNKKWGEEADMSNVPIKQASRVRRADDLEYIPDSPEYLAETISTAGWRDKIDEAFQAAIQRVKGK